MHKQSVHLDPEFSTFTYGDPARLKSSLGRRLKPGDILAFYAGLRGWDFEAEPALYIIGYFEVMVAGIAANFATEFDALKMRDLFGANFHVRHEGVYRNEFRELVLVKGSENSRLLQKACKISKVCSDNSGRGLKVLSPKMQEVFGSFGGRNSIQRSPPRWVEEGHIAGAAEFIRSLE
jgi:hypothetical protein